MPFVAVWGVSGPQSALLAFLVVYARWGVPSFKSPPGRFLFWQDLSIWWLPGERPTSGGLSTSEVTLNLLKCWFFEQLLTNPSLCWLLQNFWLVFYLGRGSSGLWNKCLVFILWNFSAPPFRAHIGKCFVSLRVYNLVGCCFLFLIENCIWTSERDLENSRLGSPTGRKPVFCSSSL